MISNQVALGIFFLYFVLMSGQCSELMNCGLQRYINAHNWIKHVMIFLSIYIFTFILNWYTFDSLIVENFDLMDAIDKRPYLEKSLYYSILIYLIFILSTKNEGKFLATFLLGSIGLVFGTIFTKSMNSEAHKQVSKHYIITNENLKKIEEKLQSEDKKTDNIETVALLQNIMNIIFIILCVLLLVGSYQYYLRQYKDHAHHWSWYVFWMGSNKCKHLK